MPRRVSDVTSKDDYATWHPDGRRVLMASERRGRCVLYLINVMF
ncbi:MAG TPA: hypothetical protein VKD72_36980 [Gemmataceae bacterium]|nr:hypothetical protein [Gemmataceae bacterium]